MNEGQYFNDVAAIDDFEDEDGEFGKAVIKLVNGSFSFPLNPQKLADPIILKNLLDLITHVEVYNIAHNILDFLYNSGFSNAHAQALFKAHMMYLDIRRMQIKGKQSEFSDDDIFNIILNIKVDEELEEGMRNY